MSYRRTRIRAMMPATASMRQRIVRSFSLPVFSPPVLSLSAAASVTVFSLVSSGSKAFLPDLPVLNVPVMMDKFMIIGSLLSKKSGTAFNGLPHGPAPPILQPDPFLSHCQKTEGSARDLSAMLVCLFSFLL